MYLNVDDIEIFLSHLTCFPILECDYKIVSSFFRVSIFLPLGSNFVFVLYKLNKKETDNFLHLVEIHVFFLLKE